MSRELGALMRFRRLAALLVGTGAVAVLALAVATTIGLRELPETLNLGAAAGVRAQILDRNGEPLTRTYSNHWNLHDAVPIYSVPELLRHAFVEAEDQRFFEHRGVDWRARVHALTQNLRERSAVRGASTITEQVVRMLHDRERTVWSRWLEGFEAQRLERHFSKGEILEFYLNQVPYARRRRGVVQAARHYFDRDLDTLNETEQLALVVLVRSPSRFDLRRSTGAARTRIDRLAARLSEKNLLRVGAATQAGASGLELSDSEIDVEAPHFARFVRDQQGAADAIKIQTTLKASLQGHVQKVLETQIELLSDRLVGDGAALVIDHRSNEVLAWVNAGGFDADREGSQIDAVLTLRQPGSTLKPFVYALALEQGWTAATVIDDAPFKRPVGRGQHAFRNYSRRFYGPVRLRQALGNSLNIPAVRAAAAVTPAALLSRLRELGFTSLDRHPDFYGEGLALGNGEVSLFELVSGYATLARGGVYQSFRSGRDQPTPDLKRRVFDETVSSLIADILADPEARRLEFSSTGVLSFPIPTAVKTGTSNDYRDAWAVGFSDQYTAGVWMGNLDLKEMQGVSGSQGPAPVLRAIFSELERDNEQESLYLSPKLRRASICSKTGSLPGPVCPTITEWFRPGRVPVGECRLHRQKTPAPAGGEDAPSVAAHHRDRPEAPRLWLSQPSPGLNMALDPRIPDEMEAFPFEISGSGDLGRIAKIEWLVDGEPAGETGPDERRFLWALAAGRHEARARIWTVAEAHPVETDKVAFYVK